MRRLLWMIGLWGCDPGANGRTDERGVDARPPDAAAPATDAEPPAADAASAGFPGGCACDAVEDCAACFARIGECCADDPTFGGRTEFLAANCERIAACRTCCAECAAASCDLLRRSGSCPVD